MAASSAVEVLSVELTNRGLDSDTVMSTTGLKLVVVCENRSNLTGGK